MKYPRLTRADVGESRLTDAYFVTLAHPHLGHRRPLWPAANPGSTTCAAQVPILHVGTWATLRVGQPPRSPKRRLGCCCPPVTRRVPRIRTAIPIIENLGSA